MTEIICKEIVGIAELTRYDKNIGYSFKIDGESLDNLIGKRSGISGQNEIHEFPCRVTIRVENLRTFSNPGADQVF